MAEDEVGSGQARLVPVPDPTLLTTEALHREVNALDDRLDTRIAGMSVLWEERFSNVDDRFEWVERQRVEQKADTRAAVDAALAAAKEAVVKSEGQATAAISQLGEKFQTAFQGLQRENGVLQSRIGALEQQKVGGKEANANLYQVVAFILALVSLGSILFAALGR
jgi:hypothetical protein